MSTESLDIFEKLRGHHLGALTVDIRRIALRRLAGQSVALLATETSRSAAAVRREIERLQDAIFIPLALVRDQWATAFWVTAHLRCCIAPPGDEEIDYFFG